MSKPANFQQPPSLPPKQQQTTSQVKYIKRTASQAFAAELNRQSYYHPNAHSLNKIPESSSRKPLSRRNSQIGPRFNYLGKNTAREEPLEVQKPVIKKFVAKNVEDIAMHLSASIFMMATTKFVPGYEDLSSMSSQAKSSRQKSIAPIKPREGQSMPHNRQKVVANKQVGGKMDSKTIVSPAKEANSNVYPSSLSGIISKSPRFNQHGSNLNQKSRLQQSFDEIASQNASRVSRPEVRIREIQPSEIVHVPSGIRTKVPQPSQSSVKSSISKNPESSIHRIADQVYVNAARYANGTNTPRNQIAKGSPQNEKAKERSISQPAQKNKAVRSYGEPLSPKKGIKEQKEEPSIIRMAQMTPNKGRAGVTPTKANNGVTPIKSSIGLESRTDLPRPQNPYTQKNPLNQQNRPNTKPAPIQNVNRNGQPPQPVQGPRHQDNNQRYPIRNRFQAEVSNEKNIPSQNANRPVPQRVSQQKKAERQYPHSSQSKEKAKQPEVPKKYPYNDTIIREERSQTQIISVHYETGSKVVRNFEHAAYHMTSEIYLNSTTKFVREAGIPPTDTIQRFSPTQRSKEQPKNEPSSDRIRHASVKPIGSAAQRESSSNKPQSKLQNRYQNQPNRNVNAVALAKQTNIKESSPSRQAKPSTVQDRIIARTSDQNSTSQPTGSRNNRFKTEPAVRDDQLPSKNRANANSASRSKENHQSPASPQKHNRASLNAKEEQIPKDNKSVEKQKSVKAEEKEEQKTAPFSRQPAGGRSPLLFTKTQQEEKNQRQPNEPLPNAQVKHTSERQIDPKARKPEISSKVSKEIPTTTVSAASPKPTSSRQPQITPAQNSLHKQVRAVEQVASQRQTTTVRRYGNRQNQTHHTNDSSYQSAKNTNNTLAGSISSDSFQKVWNNAPASKVNRNKTELSDPSSVEESVKFKGTQKQNQGKPVLQKKATIESDKSIKADNQKNVSRTNNPKITNVTSDKSIPSQEIAAKKSPNNKYTVGTTSAATQPSTNKSNKITTSSPQNSTIQSTAKGPINPTGRSRHPTTIHESSSPQAGSAKIISSVASPGKELVQTKSESHIRGIGSRDEAKKCDRAQEQNTSALPRALILVWTINKLKKNSLSKAFISLKQYKNSKQRSEKQANILAWTANSFVQQCTKGILLQAFSQLKKNYLGFQKSQKEVLVKSEDLKNRAATIVAYFLVGKIRSSFQIVRNYSQLSKQLSKTEVKSQRTQANLIVNKKQQISQRLLSSIFNIAKAYAKNSIKKGFLKILISAASSPTTKAQKGSSSHAILSKNAHTQVRSPNKNFRHRDYEAEKKALLQSKGGLESEVSSIQFAFTDKKKNFDRQKARLIKKMQEYRKKNDKFETEVTQRRKKNQGLKKTLSSTDLGKEEELFPVGEPLLSLLTKIYVEVYRSTVDSIEKRSFIEQYSLSKEDFNVIVEEWNHQAENLRLKSEIAAWEGVGAKEGKVRASLLDERAKEATLMRNYIRERYLWEWVHTVSVKL